jgi:hypothetical protein
MLFPLHLLLLDSGGGTAKERTIPMKWENHCKNRINWNRGRWSKPVHERKLPKRTDKTKAKQQLSSFSKTP